MKSLKLSLLFEANSKRPSGLGKVKDNSVEKDVEMIAGDVYDLGDHNRYTEKFKYYKGNGNGYIMDKDGNYYDVVTSTWSSDTGRIVGGTMNYSVVIKNVEGMDLSFSGYSAIFSEPSHSTIVVEIENGIYLEDFIAKHWGCLRCSDKSKIEPLKDKGNPNAKTYKTEKEESKAAKEKDFFERYLVLPDAISFEIKDDDFVFHWQPAKRKEEDKPKQTKYDIKQSDFETEDAYNAAKENIEKQWSEYTEKYKKLDKEIIETFKPFCIKKLKEFFKTDINNLNGLMFGVKPHNKNYKDKTALDTKDKKLVVISDYSKGFDKEKWKLNKEAVADIDFYPIAELDKRNPSEYLKDLFKRASDAYKKLNGRTKSKYIEMHWQDYYDWYGHSYAWNDNKTSNKGEAKRRAEAAFFKDLEEHNFERDSWKIEFDVNFLKDLIKGDLPEETKSEETKSEEKKEAPKFTGKLAEQEKKMDAWHAGTRKQNVSSCSDAKLKVNYDICVKKGYDKEAAELKKEADSRGLTLESLNLNEMKLSLQDYIDLV